MKQYPTVSRNIIRSGPFYVFDKLDGSNIRVEWTLKNGFNKFGSRKVLMDESHEFLGQAIQLFKDKYENDLQNIFKQERWQKVTVFFEYHSPNTFAGFHASEQHDLTLIDVCVYKHGILNPNEFLHIFKDLDIPKLLYYGNINQEFENSVRNGTLKGMTFEGVVCKNVRNKKHQMFKIKNQAWLDKLKDKCNGDEKKFLELM